jgi:hypothetical protein
MVEILLSSLSRACVRVGSPSLQVDVGRWVTLETANPSDRCASDLLFFLPITRPASLLRSIISSGFDMFLFVRGCKVKDDLGNVLATGRHPGKHGLFRPAH